MYYVKFHKAFGIYFLTFFGKMSSNEPEEMKSELKPILKPEPLKAHRKSKSESELGIGETKRRRSSRFDKKEGHGHGQVLDPSKKSLTKTESKPRRKEPLHLFPDPNAEPVRMYVCKAITLRKWLIFGLVLQFISLIGVITLWSCTYFLWPMKFAIAFQRGPTLMRNRIVILFLAIEPLYNFILLLLAIRLPQRLKYFLRVYYLISPYLLILIAWVGFHALLFVGNFNRMDLERNLEDGIISYGTNEGEDPSHPGLMSHEVAKDGWNDLQNYFHCCGINCVTDWKLGFVDVKREGEWHVPESCCKNQAKDCMTNPGQNNTWPRGCLDPGFKLFKTVGSMTATLCIFILFITIFCIIISTEYYSALRRGDGSDYAMNLKTYCHEFFCFGCFCCRRQRGDAKIEPNIEKGLQTQIKSEEKNLELVTEDISAVV